MTKNFLTHLSHSKLCCKLYTVLYFTQCAFTVCPVMSNDREVNRRVRGSAASGCLAVYRNDGKMEPGRPARMHLNECYVTVPSHRLQAFKTRLA